MLAGFAKTKNPAVLSPLIPLTFLVGYQGDMALGNKMERILSEWLGIYMHVQGNNVAATKRDLHVHVHVHVHVG